MTHWRRSYEQRRFHVVGNGHAASANVLHYRERKIEYLI